VVANSPALPAAFFVIAVGLVAAVTLRFSTLVGLVMAVLGTALFAVSMVMDPATAGRGGTPGLAGAFSRLDQLVPALVAAVSLVGVAVCASLASWEIDGRPGAIQEVARRGAGEQEEQEEPEEEEPSLRPGSGEEAAPLAASQRAGGPPTEPPPSEEPSTEELAAAAAPEAAPPQAPEGPAKSTQQTTEETTERAPAREAAPAEAPAAEATPAVTGAPPRDGGSPPATEQAAGGPGEEVREGAPTPETAQPAQAAPEAATETPAERREGSAVAAPAESAPPAGEVKGEEIAARDVEEKNGRAEAEQPATTRPDWRHRRRPDDDVAGRLPRRRKR
jgi:hypothetical protein